MGMRVCGSKTVISPQPIVLTISSPKVLDLTLIDLPGITRVPVGDQPADIEDQIRAMIMDFVVAGGSTDHANPNCIILAIVAGNADLATADALAIARRADPEGQRTIGVVSKLDLVDSGVDLLGVLEGRVYPLKLGFVGVVCRSFKDVEAGKSLPDQCQTEAKFFRGHAAYRTIAERCGIQYLSKYLNMILMEHIYALFPEIQGQVRQLTESSASEAASRPGFFSGFTNLGFLLASKTPTSRSAPPRPRSAPCLETAEEAANSASSLQRQTSSPADQGPSSNVTTPSTANGPGASPASAGRYTGLISGGLPRLPQVPQAIMPALVPPSQRERVEVDIIKNMLSNYLSLVQKNIADSVPKVVMFFMVNNVKDAIQRECVTKLYKEDLFDTLLEEARDVAGRRKRCHERLQALYRVIEVFAQVRDRNL